MAQDSGHESLFRLVYTSVAAMDFTQRDVAELLLKARSQNASIGVTGILLFDGTTFFQVLEGTRDIVEMLYRQIQDDRRHRDVTLVMTEVTSARLFSKWTMGYEDATPEFMRAIPGVNDFFGEASCLSGVTASGCRGFLDSFRRGVWRFQNRRAFI